MVAPRKKTVGHRLWPMLVIALIGVAGLLLGRWFFAPSSPPPPPSEPPPVMREVQLYFATVAGDGLEAETGRIEDCPELEECLRRTLEVLVAGPKGALVPVLPPRTRVQTVTIDGTTAWVSFSRELVSGHPGGSMSELLTVQALANTLAANFSHIRQIRILIEGEPVQTLKGHVDLRGPIPADFSLVRSRFDAGAAQPNEE
ncbi:GerMN domain-containing protein [Trichloromonas sp.]|uniref:GerMN domain-containing protein n=1 Tax=Trichloromonas sp. TaxID=3069249 RepID=UPI002A4BF1B5|nr:GerMN domain-containing protein [Trichloromonas sp.]